MRLGTVYFKRRRTTSLFRGRGDDGARKTADDEIDTTDTSTRTECNNGTAGGLRFRTM